VTPSPEHFAIMSHVPPPLVVATVLTLVETDDVVGEVPPVPSTCVLLHATRPAMAMAMAMKRRLPKGDFVEVLPETPSGRAWGVRFDFMRLPRNIRCPEKHEPRKHESPGVRMLHGM
jgi:hypothetical protein